MLTLAESCEAPRRRLAARRLQQTVTFVLALELNGAAAELAESDAAALSGALEGPVAIASSLSTTGPVDGSASGAVVVVFSLNGRNFRINIEND